MHVHRSSRAAGCLALLSLGWLLAPLSAPAALAQVNLESRVVPRDTYFLVMGGFYNGDYKAALKAFQGEARGGIRSTEGRWVDSICYHTMVGECYYHLGDNAKAMEQYNSALKLFLQHKDFLIRVKFPETIEPSASGVRRTINWGTSARPTKLGQFPDKMSSLQGNLNNEAAVRGGGVVAAPQYVPLRVTEILRCVAVSLRRRTELLGPICPYDPLSSQLVAALAARPTLANHWSQTWIDTLLGLAYTGTGRTAEAVTFLKRSLVVLGEYDHPLAGVALLELGKLSFQAKDYPSAVQFFHEATLSAASFGEFDVVEEGFRFGLQTQLATGKLEVYPPLLPAVNWAKSKKLRALQCSLSILIAENMAAMNDSAKGLVAAEEARRAINRVDMADGNMGARLNFVAAVLSFQQGKSAPGLVALNAALNFQKIASKWIYQIGQTDSLMLSGAITPRAAGLLFDDLLREPAARDWNIDPFDTLAYSLAPLGTPMEHWLEMAIEKKDLDKALEITDRIRRQRFFSAMPLGGRLLALRWILEAPEESLSKAALLQRQDLNFKYPRYAELGKQAEKIRQQLAAMPLVAADVDGLKQQQTLFSQLAGISSLQESILLELSVRREPSEFVFPPLRSAKEIRAALPEKTIVLTFFATSRQVHAFALSKGNYANWVIEAPALLQKQVMAMLREMGNFDKNHILPSDKLASDSWKAPAAEVLNLLLKAVQVDAWDSTDEIVVVPDGVLWYVPFEALQTPVAGGGTVSLISKVRIRYAPTVGLAVPDKRGRKPLARTAIVAGKVHFKDDETQAAESIDALVKLLPKGAVMKNNLPAPSGLMASVWDGLIVMDDLIDSNRAPFDWSPAAIDRGKPGTALSSWVNLPWGRPDFVILPGFHTPAEMALKTGGNGQEMFMLTCGLMASGTRTAVISRWRTGGRTTQELVREFVQELPHSSAANAWQRAIQLVQAAEIDDDHDPRAKLAAGEAPPKATHPLFWAGYMLLDTGSEPKK